MRITFFASLLLVGYFILVRSCVDEKPVRERQAKRTKGKGGINCPVTLPQKATRKCKLLREKELEVQRGIYNFAPRTPLPMERVNMTLAQLMAHNSQDEFLREHLGAYKSMLRNLIAYTAQWRVQHPEEMVEITTFQAYKDVFDEIKSNLKSDWFGNQAEAGCNADVENLFIPVYSGPGHALQEGSSGFKYRFASDTEPFRDLHKYWRDDDIFAEQRLSGINPMVLRRVTDDSYVGFKWSLLKKTINPNYNWEASIQAALGNDDPLDEAIKNGNVYVLRYELLDDMISFPDIVDHNPNRTLWPLESPVALFALRSKGQDKFLRPAGIQIDHKAESPVFSPADGGSWMLAKMVVQATDWLHGQMVEHALKIHLFSEAFCVVLYRQLSNKHPLNELLKYHCRGLIAVNQISLPLLLKPGGLMDKLTSIGIKGHVTLLTRGLKTLSWKNADLHLDMKERGLDDKKMLPYFPYRDDGELLLSAIRNMVKDYVNIYYRGNRQVRKDKELQAFVHELSAERSLPDGQHKPLIKDFPAKVHTKSELVDMVAKFVWLQSVHHSALNFPNGDYGAFTPLMPTKVYNDTRVPPGDFSVFNLPNGNISSAQILAAFGVSISHYDTLFYYYGELSNPLASRVVGYYYYYFKCTITQMLKDRNNKRFKSGHLTYPYLQYPWVPNGAST